MAGALHQWSMLLTDPDVTVDALAAEIGEPLGGGGGQRPVRPHDPRWARAEIISRAGEVAPALVRLVPADPTALSVAELDAELGPPTGFPVKVHFTDPVSRLYAIDPGSSGFTAALIAELPPEGGDHVAGVLLRRDIRL
jgi:hypothetical protein